jgi:uncharacterized protein (DUF1330 family)
MPKAYVICDIDVTDPEAYEGYKALSAPAVAAYDGAFIVRGGASEVLEGDRSPQRLVILEFPDVETARRWYHSPEYGEAKQARAGAATGSFILVEGAR